MRPKLHGPKLHETRPEKKVVMRIIKLLNSEIWPGILDLKPINSEIWPGILDLKLIDP